MATAELSVDCGNLPKWPGAAAAYTRAYALLEKMASSGHVTPCGKGGKQRAVSAEMDCLIRALNMGDEQAIKFALLVDVCLS